MKKIHQLNIGILGGGQLGKMLCQSASKLGLQLAILDQDRSFPAGQINSNFTVGSFKNYQDVIDFGIDKDIITIEIESVNLEGIKHLEGKGVKCYPQSNVLEIIQDKGLQKQFYTKEGFPTSPFKLYKSIEDIKSDLEEGLLSYPFVQKARKDGYDGQGVVIIKSEKDLDNLLLTSSVVEDAVKIKKELSVIVARNPEGEIKSFPMVEMVFHPTANLVEYLISPCKVPQEIENKGREIAEKLAERFSIVGLLAVELFWDENDDVLINEVAPRPHNSGHQTIEANITSQYQQHLRAILNLPLGSTDMIQPSVMVNLLGDPNHTGKAIYNGFEDCLNKSGVHLHIYGKEITKPFRKMGHATIVDRELEQAIEKAKFVQQKLKITT